MIPPGVSALYLKTEILARTKRENPSEVSSNEAFYGQFYNED